MFDEDPSIWFKAVKYVATICVILLVILLVASKFGYKLSKPQQEIIWLQNVITTEHDAQGNTSSVYIVGLDDKGYVRWGKTPAPAPQPPAKPAQPVLSQEPAKAK